MIPFSSAVGQTHFLTAHFKQILDNRWKLSHQLCNFCVNGGSANSGLEVPKSGSSVMKVVAMNIVHLGAV